MGSLQQDVLDAADFAVRVWLEAKRQQTRGGPRQKDDYRDHDAVFAAYGFVGPRQSTNLVHVIQNLAATEMQCLTGRESDCLFFKVVVRGTPPGACRGALFIHDLFHSLQRIANRVAPVDQALAVCPHSTMFLCGGQWRPLVPPEYFALMGLYINEWGIDPSPGEWSWNELVDLAGHAFDGHSFMAAAILLMVQAGHFV